MISLSNLSQQRQFNSINIDNDSSDDSILDNSTVVDEPLDLAVDLEISKDLLEREEKYKLMNSQLKSKTAKVVQEAQALVKEGLEILANPVIPNSRPNDSSTKSRPSSGRSKCSSITSSAPNAKKVTTTRNNATKKRAPELPISEADIVQRISNRLKDGLDVALSGNEKAFAVPVKEAEIGLEASNRYLKARLAVLHEELIKYAQESRQSQIASSTAQERLRLTVSENQKLTKQHSTVSGLLTKSKKQNEELSSEYDRVTIELNTLKKEMDTLKRDAKQCQADQSTKDIRLNRALEEIEKWKNQAAKVSAEAQDQTDMLKRTIINLQVENRLLEKQQQELLLAFKKQLMLIDVLKRQKIHIEAAKLLSFTEDEFVKILNWEG